MQTYLHGHVLVVFRLGLSICLFHWAGMLACQKWVTQVRRKLLPFHGFSVLLIVQQNGQYGFHA